MDVVPGHGDEKAVHRAGADGGGDHPLVGGVENLSLFAVIKR